MLNKLKKFGKWLMNSEGGLWAVGIFTLVCFTISGLIGAVLPETTATLIGVCAFGALSLFGKISGIVIAHRLDNQKRHGQYPEQSTPALNTSVMNTPSNMIALSPTKHVNQGFVWQKRLSIYPPRLSSTRYCCWYTNGQQDGALDCSTDERTSNDIRKGSMWRGVKS